MKAKKLATLEKYTSVAVRAKISVEVEQKKRLGAWGKRVLVLDGTTLYAYKTKGDGGSVGGWAIGGADVHVRRNNDSNRDDGRHILVIARPPVYKLVFAFATVYEQARMIQALSSSGATVTGLDAIMLLKNLRQQQEQEKKEEEERQRQQNAQKNAEKVGDVNKSTKDEDKTAKSNGAPKGKEPVEEVEEINESIYDQNKGMVNNPLYTSSTDLTQERGDDQPDGAILSIARNAINSPKASDSEASQLQGLSTDQDSEDKVNPVPKPPRASISEGSPMSDTSVPDTDNREENVAKTEEDSHQQSALSSDIAQEDLSSVIATELERLTSAIPFGNTEQVEDTLAEAINDLHDNSDEDTEEGEGFYEVTPDNEEKNHIAQKERESIKEVGNFENNYVELISKMKLERGLSIDSQNGGPIGEGGSPEGVRKILGGSLVKSSSPENDSGSDRETNRDEDSDKSADEKTTDISLVTEDISSDNDEKFEQLYRELSSNMNDEKEKNLQNKDLSDAVKKTDYEGNVPDQADNENISNGTVPGGDFKEEGVISEKSTTEGDETPEGTSIKRVNSIIKKKGSPNSGKTKKVQFNLDATTIDSDSITLPKTPLPAKEPPSPTVPESPSKKKGSGAPATLDGSASPSKKKGIFSNIFSSASSKKSYAVSSKDETVNNKESSSSKVETKPSYTSKGDAVSKKEPVVSKIDTGTKKTPGTSQANVKRQSTVDLAAPLIISGSVEMGGSISGKVTPRRIEVRDGHVLAFMPKASNPTSRLSLVGLSVTPMIGGIHPNALSLTRANRCMMVIKLTSREEMMKWINVLSDEVIKLTPENQRTGLVLYPSPKNEEPKEEETEEAKEEETNETMIETKDTVDKVAPQELKIVEKNKKELDVSPGSNRSTGKTKTVPREITITGNENTLKMSEDTSDGWLRQRRHAPLQESEMKMTEKSQVTVNGECKANIKENINSSIDKQSHITNVERFKEDRETEKAVRKINKLNIEEIWKEHKDTPKKVNPTAQRRYSENMHPPLRRISGQENLSTRRKSESQMTPAYQLGSNSPKKDYHANCHPPLQRLSNRNRILSASETNLQKSGELKPLPNTHRLHRFGSDLALAQNPKREFNNNTINDTKDASNVLVSSRILRNQGSLKNNSKGGRVSAAPMTSSPTHKNYRTSLEPREVEIIETKKSNIQEPLRISNGEVHVGRDHWYEENGLDNKDNELAEENLPGITWSVAATREKFELLCSVSGENKSGKLTTKTPISRKKSIKKKRSFERDSGRRPSQKSIRKSLQGTSNKGTVSPALSLDNDSLSSQTNSQDNLSESNNDIFKLPPVRDLRKNFEADVVDGGISPIYKSSSMGSLNDLSPTNQNDNRMSPTKDHSNTTKTQLRRTQNVLQAASSPASSPEPEFITSKFINGRPKGNLPEQDKGIVSKSLTAETNGEKDNEVVICWKGPYIAQEAEQAVLSNISNAFLAKRRLLAREVAMARIQEKLSSLEETIWDIQASMAELDKQPSPINVKSTNNWKTLERSLKAAEEDMTYWTSRLTQTQKEADEAREKLATALVTGLTQYNAGEPMPQRQRQKLLRRYTKGSLKDNFTEEEEEDDDEEKEEDHENEMEDSFA